MSKLGTQREFRVRRVLGATGTLRNIPLRFAKTGTRENLVCRSALGVRTTQFSKFEPLGSPKLGTQRKFGIESVLGATQFSKFEPLGSPKLGTQRKFRVEGVLGATQFSKFDPLGSLKLGTQRKFRVDAMGTTFRHCPSKLGTLGICIA